MGFCGHTTPYFNCLNAGKVTHCRSLSCVFYFCNVKFAPFMSEWSVQYPRTKIKYNEKKSGLCGCECVTVWVCDRGSDRPLGSILAKCCTPVFGRNKSVKFVIGKSYFMFKNDHFQSLKHDMSRTIRQQWFHRFLISVNLVTFASAANSSATNGSKRLCITKRNR